ncbi:5'-nucleotidase, lipoprotein e(P4) family [Novilysobacter spongiicola]|uniref:Acid phosphatase n=1 Tax=Lysobacter spongiicola DSM 21749 TaxID=1122188 RepID=A0A1T4S368_9GAMM|nr:5'-nucleotidase, lipoprotein e(P4) family [Lysobacter spongiicola]SKA22673.1 acid phosphatase [Lysobacter spongiicola DSM 21749]
MSLRLHAVALTTALSLLAGCQHGAVRPAPDDNLNAVLWMQSSAEYAAGTRQAYRAAAERLDQALADPDWSALAPGERPASGAGRRPAVVLDVDETVLDNSPYQARLVRDGAEFDEATWAAWVAEASARPVPGVLDFAREASERGVTLLYVSNRTEEQQAATLRNLRSAGLPVVDETVFLGKGMEVEGCRQESSSDKHCRRQWVGQRYRVLMQFGDQLGDFVRVEPNSPAHRRGLVETHGDWFGERWWILPNPSYGDWQPAVFDNQWSRPAAERRAAKRDALETAR